MDKFIIRKPTSTQQDGNNKTESEVIATPSLTKTVSSNAAASSSSKCDFEILTTKSVELFCFLIKLCKLNDKIMALDCYY